MKRLTFEGNFCDISKCKDTPGGSFCENGYCDRRRVWERLKAYEDIGTVEEFAALVQAESEDCKICIWKNRHQKCACCKRNRHLKDCFAAHAAKEEQG